MPATDQIYQILAKVNYPGSNNDIVTYGVVRRVEATADGVEIDMEVLAPTETVARKVREAAESALRSAGVLKFQINMNFRQFGNAPGMTTATGPAGPHGTSGDPWADRKRIDGVKRVIAVASGKGGVGKSTVAVNLAIAMRSRGLKVGLLDADIYGPSAPIMLGLSGAQPDMDAQQIIQPLEAYGLKVMSMGFLVDDEKPVIWRGPIVMKMIEQMLRGVRWGQLDVLVIDLPPGTGDVQLSLVQKLPIEAAIIVTTPQAVALADVTRGKAMFDRVEVPVAGIVENMSTFVCPDCGHEHHIFAHGGGKSVSEALDLPLLVQIPLDPNLVAAMDAGRPVAAMKPDDPITLRFKELADKVIAYIDNRSPATAAKPSLVAH